MKNTDSAAYYHVCTDGNALEWMFKDTIDFIAGMNRIAICSLDTGVIVVAFVLMDNHVHLVLHGTMPQCKQFISKYKLLTGKWIRKRHGLEGHLRGLPSSLILIENEEQLLDTIAYIDRNPVIAGYHLLPGEYPWGSAQGMFTDECSKSTAAISEMNKKEIHQMLNTWAEIPLDWRIDSNGMLALDNIWNKKLAENHFRSPLKYLYHISKKLEGRIEMHQGTKSFIPDKELRPLTEKMSEEMFGTTDLKSLDFNNRIYIARKLRYNYASTPKQISRILHLDCEILSKFI